jgi:hypothetical protein
MIGTRAAKPLTDLKLTNIGLKYFGDPAEVEWDVYVVANGIDVRLTDLIDQMVQERLARALAKK